VGKAIFKTVLAALKSTTGDVKVAATFVGSHAERTLAQGRRYLFLAATCSMVRIHHKLL
jgi:hypothetical protein